MQNNNTHSQRGDNDPFALFDIDTQKLMLGDQKTAIAKNL